MINNQVQIPFLFEIKDGQVIPLSKDFDQWARFNEGPRIGWFSRIEDIPSWEQYKYLIGVIGKRLIDDGYYENERDFIISVEMKFNPVNFKYKDHETGEILEGTRPGSISMTSISKKRLAEITDLVIKSCEKVGIYFDIPFEEWLKQHKVEDYK